MKEVELLKVLINRFLMTYRLENHDERQNILVKNQIKFE